jgi:hypothetical protein
MGRGKKRKLKRCDPFNPNRVTVMEKPNANQPVDETKLTRTSLRLKLFRNAQKKLNMITHGIDSFISFLLVDLDSLLSFLWSLLLGTIQKKRKTLKRDNKSITITNPKVNTTQNSQQTERRMQQTNQLITVILL